MKIFSFVEQAAQTAYAAAPATANPLCQSALAERPRLRVLERDAFTPADRLAHAGQTQPVLPSLSETYDWLVTHSVQEARERLKRHLQAGTPEDVRQAVGLFNAAHKGQKLMFKDEEAGRARFSQYLGLAVEALREQDWPAAKVYLQRLKRVVGGFQNLPPAVVTGAS